jgi:hypothetical protein
MNKKHILSEQLKVADNLAEHIALIREKISAIEKEGEVAEPGHTIMRYQAGNPSKKYWYYKLQSKYPVFTTKSGKLSKYKHLGRGGSDAHIEALMQISRRSQIEALYRTLDCLMKSLDDLVDNNSSPKTPK